MLTLLRDVCIITNVPIRRSGGMADALDSKSSGFTLVPVRVRPSAPANSAVYRKIDRFFVFQKMQLQ